MASERRYDSANRGVRSMRLRGWAIILTVLALLRKWWRGQDDDDEKLLLSDAPTLEVLPMSMNAVVTVTLPTQRQPAVEGGAGRPLMPDEIQKVVLQLATRDQDSFYVTVKEWLPPEGEFLPATLSYTQSELEDGPWFFRAYAVTAEGNGASATARVLIGDGTLQVAAAPGITVEAVEV